MVDQLLFSQNRIMSEGDHGTYSLCLLVCSVTEDEIGCNGRPDIDFDYLSRFAITRALEASAFPSSYAANDPSNRLRVFFEAPTLLVGGEDAEQNGSHGFVLRLRAPSSFAFAEDCTDHVSDLDDAHYDYPGQFLPIVRRMVFDSCEGSTYPGSTTRNLAKVTSREPFRNDGHYAFSIQIANPAAHSTEQEYDWDMWFSLFASAADTVEIGVAGVRTSVPFAQQAKSWGLFTAGMVTKIPGQAGVPACSPGLMVQSLAGLRAHDLVQQSSAVTFAGLGGFESDMTVRLVIKAPLGYRFIETEEEQSYRDGAAISGELEDCTVLPPGTKVSGLVDELVWDSITLNADTIYGLATGVEVPLVTPQIAPNEFIVFITSPDSDSDLVDRHYAQNLPAPPVRAVAALSVAWLSQGANEEHWIRVKARIVSPLGVGSGFIFSGDLQAKGYELGCPVEAAFTHDDMAQWPEGVSCEILEHDDQTPYAQLTITSETSSKFVSGEVYGFILPIKNPELPAAATAPAAVWSLTTYDGISDYRENSASFADAVSSVSCYNPAVLMKEGAFYSETLAQRAISDRDDRPGRINTLEFVFALKDDYIEQTARPIHLRITGPPGFRFKTNCRHDQIVAPMDAQGNSAETSLSNECRGDDSMATIVGEKCECCP